MSHKAYYLHSIASVCLHIAPAKAKGRHADAAQPSQLAKQSIFHPYAMQAGGFISTSTCIARSTQF